MSTQPKLQQYGFIVDGVGHVLTSGDVLRLYAEVPQSTVYRWLLQVPRADVPSTVNLYLLSDVTRIFEPKAKAYAHSNGVEL